MTENIYYLVGPNGTGKTRALNKLCEEHNGFYIPKQRPQNIINFSEEQTEKFIKEFKTRSKENPEYVAMSLLRENAKLRFKVFEILSRKLGRNFSVEIVERSQNFKITSGLDGDFFETVSIPRYDLRGESSGLRELLILLTLVNSDLSKNFFIDEPELSLHPQLPRESFRVVVIKDTPALWAPAPARILSRGGNEDTPPFGHPSARGE